MVWLDRYERQARLAPGLLAILPVTVVVTALGVRQAPVVAGLLSLLSLAGGPVLLSAYVRQRGLDMERRLVEQWDGLPTTRMLRMRSADVSSIQRDQWRTGVAQATGIDLASASEEQEDPNSADEKIGLAVGRLRESTRGPKFPLVQAEVRNYGFERNFLGMKRSGVTVALVCLVLIVAAIGYRAVAHVEPIAPQALLLGVVGEGLLLGGWLTLPSAKRVRTTAEKYAHQLLQSVEAVTAAKAASSGGA